MVNTMDINNAYQHAKDILELVNNGVGIPMMIYILMRMRFNSKLLSNHMKHNTDDIKRIFRLIGKLPCWATKQCKED
jgi:hypothetical protein